MKTFVLLLLATALSVSGLSAADPCPICGGEITAVGKVEKAPSNYQKNEWVWSTSPDCGLSLFNDNSPICKRCWFAKDSDGPNAWWVRSSVLPDSFFIPLSAAIRKFPAPPHSANYDQKFIQGKRTDSLAFHCENSPEIVSKFRKYCKENQLSIDVTELDPNELFINVTQEEAQRTGIGKPISGLESKSKGKKKPQPKAKSPPR